MAESRKAHRTLVALSLSGASITAGILRLGKALVKSWTRAVVFASLALLGAAVAAQQQQSVWDGVYTSAQAERGAQLFKKTCGHCHRDDLAGGGSEAGAPALKGPIFV